MSESQKNPADHPAPSSPDSVENAASDTTGGDSPARLEALMAEARTAYEQARQEVTAATHRLRDEIRSFDAAEARDKTRAWVRENPGLALLLAAGAGMVLGKALADALRKEPLTWKDRARLRANRLATDARRFADEAVAASSEQVAGRLRDLGETVHRHAGDLGADGLRRAQGWIHSLAETAENATRSLQQTAREASAAARRVPEGLSLRDGFDKAIQALFGMLAFKKISDWIKERY